MVSAGMWERLADGTCMWRLSIVSPGAQSHVLVFRNDYATLLWCATFISACDGLYPASGWLSRGP